jgi:hypothetical protein
MECSIHCGKGGRLAQTAKKWQRQVIEKQQKNNKKIIKNFSPVLPLPP